MYKIEKSWENCFTIFPWFISHSIVLLSSKRNYKKFFSSHCDKEAKSFVPPQSHLPSAELELRPPHCSQLPVTATPLSRPNPLVLCSKEWHSLSNSFLSENCHHIWLKWTQPTVLHWKATAHYESAYGTRTLNVSMRSEPVYIASQSVPFSST